MKNIELLVKPVSFDCNLACSYCFYKSTESIYGAGKHLMEDKILETLVLKAMQYSNGGLAVFSWQGGEPLLAGVTFYRRVIELQQKHGKKGQRVGNSVQTNGTLLNEEFIKLFKEYNFLLGISLDGDRPMHEFHRGKSFEGAMKGIALLRELELDFNILTVINSFNASRPADLYNFYVKEGFDFVQLIPCVEKDSMGKLSEFSVDSKTYCKFLCEFFDLWWNGGKPAVSVRFFDNILEILSGYDATYCGFKSTCGDYLALEYNGDIYPCDFFVKKERKLGSIKDASFEDSFRLAKENFGVKKADVNEKCALCKWKYICNGGCLKYRLIKDDNFSSLDYLCEAYKEFFGYSIVRLKTLAGGIRQ